MTTISYLQAIRDAQLEEMRRDERVFIMGEDVAWNMLGSTEGFVEESGPNGCVTRQSPRPRSPAPRLAPRWSACGRSST